MLEKHPVSIVDLLSASAALHLQQGVSDVINSSSRNEQIVCSHRLGFPSLFSFFPSRNTNTIETFRFVFTKIYIGIAVNASLRGKAFLVSRNCGRGQLIGKPVE